jgi:hypothetical protein
MVAPRSDLAIILAILAEKTCNDIGPAIAPAYGFGSQLAFPKIEPVVQIPSQANSSARAEVIASRP